MKTGIPGRLLALLLAAVMVIAMLPLSAVAAPEAATWTKVALADIKESDTIAITMTKGDTTWLLPTTEATKAPPVAEVAVIKSGKLETSSSDTYGWTLAKSGKSGYTIKAGGNYLCITGKKANTLRVTNQSAVWELDGTYLKTATSAGGDRYLGVYDGSSWRHYSNPATDSNSNIKNQTVGFWKLEAADARESGIVTDLSTLQKGDKVVIFNTANLRTLSTDYSGFYNTANEVTLTDGKLEGFKDVDLWTLTKNEEDGTYTIATADGKKLSMDTSFTSTPLDKANAAWKITAVEAKDGYFYIDNATRTDKYRMQYRTDMGTWSAYTGTGDAFEQQFYYVAEKDLPTDPEPDPDPEPGPGPVAAPLADGDQVVIYNPANLKALSTEYSGFYNKGTDVTLADGKLSGYTDADIWTVGVNADGTYTFSTSEGKKLSMDTQFSSTPLDKANTAWEILDAKTANCVYIKNKARSSYLEWYADKNNWSSYGSIGNNEALFAQAFYKIRKSGIVTRLSDGDKVVVFNPANLKALSTEYSGFYNKGTDVTLTDGKLSGYTKADIWTVGVNADGTYTFSTSEGKKLSMDTQFSSTPLDKANTAWEILDAKTANCVYIKNKARSSYLEWYADKNNWSSYGSIGNNEALFAQQFYLVADDDTPTPPTPGNLPKPGDKFVIYNQNAKGVLAAENDSKSIENVAATIENGKAIPGNGAVIFTVETNGEYYRFKSEAYGYLCSNGTGSNAFYSKDFSEEGVTANDADWLVRTCSGGVGGFEMESRTAKFSGHSQWLEYYNDSYKSYSMYNKDGKLDYTLYSFFFYPVAEGVNVIDGLVVKPTITFPEVMLDAYVGQDYEFELDINTIYPIDDPWTEYSIQCADGSYIPGISELQSDTDVEVLDGFVSGKGKVHITVFDSLVAKAAAKGDYMILTFAFKDTKGNEAKASYKVTIKDEPVIDNVSPKQGAQTLDDKRPEISADVINAGENPTVKMTIDGKEVNATYESGKVSYKPTADMEDGRKVITLTVTRTDSKSATKTWSFTVGEAKYQLYFGQLHSHTQYSDGAGSLDSALQYIKNISEQDNVQFVAFTDHSNYFDSKNNPNVEGALYDTSLVKDSDANHSWKTYKDTVAQFNEANAGSMVALGGFEMTWSGGPGHINTFNTPGIVSRNNSTLNNKTSDAGMKAYYALLSQKEGIDTISQFNHPGTTFGTFSDFAYWDAVIDTRMYLVEVGNGEGQIGAGGYYPSYEQYIVALDKGWHVAPTNNQDNHKGKWGNANAARDVILTDDFSEQGLYNAIRARRVYATEDKNLEINYTVNGQMLGSIISEVPEKLNIAVSVNDPDRTDSITKVEVVVNSGKTIYTWDNPADLATGNLTCTLDPDYSYYFIRVTEGDGDLAVTAPVWVGETLKLGISNLVCGTATPVTNEELTLTTTLFNSEAKDATVKSLTYTIGDEVIGTDTTGHAIAASSTQDITFNWTPTKAKVTTITVTAIVEQNGKEYTFTKQIELDVLDADSLVYIGIDASHYNEYVAGNYKDSMGNFGNLAAQYSVRVVYLKTSEELIAACSNEKYKALILTAPSRRLADAQADPKTYSAAELAAIQDFNAKGGTVVLAGWSDNYENYDVIKNNPAIKHMAATQNEVLAALGSSLRISDDATYDDVRSAADGVDPWRLYFSDYNMDSFLMDRVEVDAEHPYDKLYTERFSHYGGASIYAVDANGTATSTLPATVSPVVYGHATTYSKDVDADGLGGAGIPKYTFKKGDNRLMVMASEKLDGKGLIVVSGAAFMSNFEVQATISDNGSEKNYSNYKICENLIKYLNPVKVTPIAKVQAEKEEGIKYTIEGIVTSNASGYDKNTAFFDCIYVQDETAGINAFPVAGEFKIGDKVRITGTTSSYQGERQIAVTSIEKIGEGTPVEPKKVTAAELENQGYLGSLVTVEGTATKIESADGLIQTIMVKDASGKEARVFIDGYITTAEDVKNAVVGCHVVATGLASYDNTFVLEDGTPVAQRIRIRNRADVVCEPVFVITFDANGGQGEMDAQTLTNNETAKLTKSQFTRPGYTFAGWNTMADGTGTAYDDEVEFTAAGQDAITLYAQWTANTDTAYTVEHYQQNVNDNEYTLVDTQPLSGTTDTLTAAAAKSYTGFTAKEFDQLNIDGTGSTVVKVYYDRNSYTLTWDANGGAWENDDPSGEVRFGAKITLPVNPTREGYEFVKWDSVPETMPAGNVTIKAEWKDVTPPTGKITVDKSAWDKLLESLTFGLYSSEKQTVTITAEDNSGLDVTIEYYVDENPTKALIQQELEGKELAAYTEAFEIKPDGEFVVYAKLTDQAGNVTWISSDGIVLDATAPVIIGAEDGKTYCEAVDVTINERYIKAVTLNGKPVQLDNNNGLKINPADGEQTLEVIDEAGNKTTITFTVNDGHTPEEDDGDCTTAIHCKFCDEITTAAKEHDFTGEWKHDAEGHWHECKNDSCTKRSEKAKHTFEWVTDVEATSKKAGTKHEECKTCGLKQNENTVIPATKTPKTGDESNLMLWISLMILSAGTVLAVIFGKKKSKASK